MIYRVSAGVVVSCYTEVEASSEDEAIAIALAREMAGVSVNSWEAREAWLIDNDGTPFDACVEGFVEEEE